MAHIPPKRGLGLKAVQLPQAPADAAPPPSAAKSQGGQAPEWRMRSMEGNLPDPNEPVTAANAEVLAKAQRYPYNHLDDRFQRQKPARYRETLREDKKLSSADRERVHQQWLDSVNILGKGWKGDKVLGRGAFGIAGKFDWVGFEGDLRDRTWEKEKKSLVVKQSRYFDPLLYYGLKAEVGRI
jgi:hypothetical protein